MPNDNPELTDKQLDDMMDKLIYSELDRSMLPIASIAIDYDRDILVLWTPDLTIGDKVQKVVGDTAFVLLYEEAPPRWEHDGPEPETTLEDVQNSCANDSPQERMANPLRYSNGTHVFLNLGCEWQKIGEFTENEN